MKYSDGVFWWILAILALIGMTILFCGCLSSHTSHKPPVLLPATVGEQALVKLVDQNWLVTLGILLTVVGVMTGINGSTKFMAWIGGGLTLLALAALTATFFALVASYSGWIMLVLGTLIVIGIVAFFHGAADANDDGKINWQDVKQLFRWK